MDRSHRRLPTTVSAASKVLTPQDGPLRPSSVTSHHVSILEATKGREPVSHPSGPGSSTTGGMLSNPFCFVLQVLAVLQEIRLSQRGCLPGIKQAELLRRYGPEPSPLADYGISSIKVLTPQDGHCDHLR
ncbi:hypothetical protein MRX96_002110 [Rhipicephalus microplus]